MGSVPVGRKKRADATTGPQTFRSPTAVVVWWVWLLFAAANLIDLAVQGRDHLTLVAGAILILVTGGAYVTAQRPRVIADTAGVTVVNPLRDHHVGWANVAEVDLADLLRVHCDVGQGRTKLIQCWSVQYSRRRKFAADAKARRISSRSGRLPAGGFGLDRYTGRNPGPSYSASQATAPTAEAEAERIVKVLTEHVTAARAEKIWAEGTVEIAGLPAGETAEAAARLKPAEVPGWLDPLTSSWSRKALLVLLIPVLLLIVAAVV